MFSVPTFCFVAFSRSSFLAGCKLLGLEVISTQCCWGLRDSTKDRLMTIVCYCCHLSFAFGPSADVVSGCSITHFG